VSTTATRPLRRGRPPKHPSGTLTMRWWLMVNPDQRRAAEARATAEGITLADAVRAFLDAYAAGTVDAPQVTR
jgi:hypothetical protein